MLQEELRIAWRIALTRVRGQMQYRASFAMQIFGSFIINSVELKDTGVILAVRLNPKILPR